MIQSRMHTHTHTQKDMCSFIGRANLNNMNVETVPSICPDYHNEACTCIRRQVEVKDSNDGDENAGKDDVEDVVQRLPLDDQVKSHVLILVIHVLPAWLVSDVPLAALWRSEQLVSLSHKQFA